MHAAEISAQMFNLWLVRHHRTNAMLCIKKFWRVQMNPKTTINVDNHLVSEYCHSFILAVTSYSKMPSQATDFKRSKLFLASINFIKMRIFYLGTIPVSRPISDLDSPLNHIFFKCTNLWIRQQLQQSCVEVQCILYTNTSNIFPLPVNLTALRLKLKITFT